MLKHIKMVRWQFRDITADYQMGADAAAVFLSIRCASKHYYALPACSASSGGGLRRWCIEVACACVR